MKILYTLSLVVLCAGSAIAQAQEITVVAWMREMYSREDHDFASREEYRCSYAINYNYADPCARAENVDSEQWESFSRDSELQVTLPASTTSFLMSLSVWEEDGGDGCKIDDGGDSDSHHGIGFYPSLTTLNPRSDNETTRVVNNSANTKKGYEIAYTILWFSNTLRTPAFVRGPGREICFSDDLRVETSYHGMSNSMSATYYWEVYDESTGITTPYSRGDNKLDLRDHIKTNPASSRNLRVRVATFVRGMQASLYFSNWFDVTINGTPTVSMGNTIQPECAGQKGSITVSSVSGASDRYNLYLVRDGITVKQYIDLPAWTPYTFTDIDAGTYTLKVADRTGASCFYEVNNLIIDAAPQALGWQGGKSDFNGFNVSCANNADGSITLAASGGSGQYIYLYENREITTFTGKPAGSYSITVRDRVHPSCEVTATENLTAPSSLHVGDVTSAPVSCRNSPDPDGLISIASVTGGVGPYQYQLDDEPWQESNVFSSLAAGQYTISIRDKNSCIITQVVEVNQPSANVSSEILETSDVSCFGGNDGSVLIRGNGGVPFESGLYKFSIDNGVFSEPKVEQRYENLSAGTYHITIHDKNGCVHTTEVAIGQPTALDNEVMLTPVSCDDRSDGSAVITLSGGTVPYFYLDTVSGDAIQISNDSDSITLGGLAAGDYTVKVKDSNGCSNGSESAWLEIPLTIETTPALEAVLNPEDLIPASCIGSADGGTIIYARNGTPGYWFSDNGQDFVAGSEGDRHSFGSLVGGNSYTFYIRDSRACTSQIQLTVPQPQVPEIDDEIVICPGQAYDVEVSLDGTYRWTSTNGFSSAERKVRLSEEGTYVLRVTTNQNCQIEQTFDVRVVDVVLNADLLMSSEAVEGDTLVAIDLSSPRPESHAWVYNTSDISHIRSEQFYDYFRFNKAGMHSLQFIVSIGACSDTLVHYVDVSGREGINAPEGRLDENEPFVRNFDVWPNPTSDRFSIDVELREVADITIRLVSAVTSRPQLIKTERGADQYRVLIDVADIPAGLYFVQLETSKGYRRVLRLIIEN